MFWRLHEGMFYHLNNVFYVCKALVNLVPNQNVLA
jgi:hypothetical protein